MDRLRHRKAKDLIMSNPLNSLKNLIKSKAIATVGIVVRDAGAVLYISTPNGTKEMPKAGTDSYTQGDSVRVFNGVVVGKVPSDKSLPHYYV